LTWDFGLWILGLKKSAGKSPEPHSDPTSPRVNFKTRLGSRVDCWWLARGPSCCFT
jgi:hypothetical protein